MKTVIEANGDHILGFTIIGAWSTNGVCAPSDFSFKLNLPGRFQAVEVLSRDYPLREE